MKVFTAVVALIVCLFLTDHFLTEVAFAQNTTIWQGSKAGERKVLTIADVEYAHDILLCEHPTNP